MQRGIARFAGFLIFSALPLPVLADLIADFEEPSLAGKLNGFMVYEGETGLPSTFRSGGVRFSNDGVYWGGSSWSGFGISRKTERSASNLYDEGDDLIAKPGTGSGGSATWSVLASGGTMKADLGYTFRSLDLTNNLYAWTSMTQGDTFAGPPLRNGGGTGRYEEADDFFAVRFTDTADNDFLDVPLADFRGADDYVIDSWTTVDLSQLAADELEISFLGSRETLWGDTYYLDTPAYAAFDNVSVSAAAVPEPGTFALLSAAAVSLGGYRRFRRYRSASCERINDG